MKFCLVCGGELADDAPPKPVGPRGRTGEMPALRPGQPCSCSEPSPGAKEQPPDPTR
jgi:hypothetical protein